MANNSPTRLTAQEVVAVNEQHERRIMKLGAQRRYRSDEAILDAIVSRFSLEGTQSATVDEIVSKIMALHARCVTAEAGAHKSIQLATEAHHMVSDGAETIEEIATAALAAIRELP